MNLVDELGNDLALAFLVEKKHTEKLNSTEILALIEKVKRVLQPISLKEKTKEMSLIAPKTTNATTH
ncbi:MAG: hypothetical protein LC768_08105 [Acidobacteria bacterium]|nr:hypothetical protein [Acidobacteriota bacterium]MCA1638283.1 hypothetical protein [Acidobacteriota bacterium]